MIRLFFIFLITIVLIKIVLFSILTSGSFSLGGGNDADYYHCYTIGNCSYAVNIWPVILRWFSDIGLYSREGIVILLNFFVLFLIPFVVAKLTMVSGSSIKNRTFWLVFFLMTIYPTLNFYALDIYRDVCMVLLFALGLYFFKYLSISENIIGKILIFLLAVAWGYLLYLFRPYLGMGYWVALICSRFYDFYRVPTVISIMVLLIGLNILGFLGYLDPILTYREGFLSSADGGGGATLGINLSSGLGFTPGFLKSFFYQMFGLYFVNFSSIFIFFVESVPFIYAFIYVIRNKRYANKFVNYLMLFFVAYSSVWLIGNDNLGTAVRLRMYSYIAIGVAFCIIYQNKRIALMSLGRSS